MNWPAEAWGMLSRLRAGSTVLTCASPLAAGLLLAAPAANAATPAAAKTGVPASHTEGTAVPASTASVSALPGQTGQQLTLHVADGLNPTRVTGTIAVAGQAVQGTIRVTAKGRTLLKAPAGANLTLDAPVTAADLTHHELILNLDYLPAVQNVCTAAQSADTLSKVALVTSGTEAAPATVAEFLAPSVPAVLIPVPANPPSDVSAAILAASAAMAHRYPDAALVPEADAAAPARDGAGERTPWPARTWATVGAPVAGRHVPGTAVIAGAAAVVGFLACLYTTSSGSNLDYSDAQSHLTIARRVFDSKAPGFEQLGTVWLPMPHLLLVPFIVNLWMFSTGWGACILPEWLLVGGFPCCSATR